MECQLPWSYLLLRCLACCQLLLQHQAQVGHALHELGLICTRDERAQEDLHWRQQRLQHHELHAAGVLLLLLLLLLPSLLLLLLWVGSGGRGCRARLC
jgi:hypothetical protein